MPQICEQAVVLAFTKKQQRRRRRRRYGVTTRGGIRRIETLMERKAKRAASRRVREFVVNAAAAATTAVLSVSSSRRRTSYSPPRVYTLSSQRDAHAHTLFFFPLCPLALSLSLAIFVALKMHPSGSHRERGRQCRQGPQPLHRILL